jgi:LSD1 subclass zinc finger protein
MPTDLPGPDNPELAAEYEAVRDELAAAGPNNGGICPGCRRVMSVREGAEQGRCNECLEGWPA